MGLDALNPLEVKAGMDPVLLKQQYGDRLVLHGGVNAVLWDKVDEIKAEMERVIPVIKENGGFIFSSDHSVPSSVSLEDFRRIVELAKKLVQSGINTSAVILCVCPTVCARLLAYVPGAAQAQ